MVATTELRGKGRDRKRDKLNWSNDVHEKRKVKNCPGRFFPLTVRDGETKCVQRAELGRVSSVRGTRCLPPCSACHI